MGLRRWIVACGVIAWGCGPASEAPNDGALAGSSDEGAVGADAVPPECGDTLRDAPLCDEECILPGCCRGCGSDQCMSVADGGDAIGICVEGQCIEPMPCQQGCTYLPDGGGPTCVEALQTCAEIASSYVATNTTRTSVPDCGTSADCNVVAGHCDIGLGGFCWAWGSPVVQARLSALAQRWVELGCALETTCSDCSVPSGTCPIISDVNDCEPVFD